MKDRFDEPTEGLAQSVARSDTPAPPDAKGPIRIAEGLDPQQERGWAQIVARAWDDAEFRRRLLACPSETLREAGFNLPEDAEVEVVEQEPAEMADDVGYLRLPGE